MEKERWQLDVFDVLLRPNYKAQSSEAVFDRKYQPLNYSNNWCVQPKKYLICTTQKSSWKTTESIYFNRCAENTFADVIMDIQNFQWIYCQIYF